MHACENTSQWTQTIHCVLQRALQRSAEVVGRLHHCVDSPALASQKREQRSKVRIFGSKTKSRESMQSVPTLPSKNYLGMQINFALCTALIRSLALKVRIFGRRRQAAHWCGSNGVLHSPLRILKILFTRNNTREMHTRLAFSEFCNMAARATRSRDTARHPHHLRVKGELFREHRRAIILRRLRSD